MNVYEMYEKLNSEFSDVECVNKDTKAIYKSIMDLPINFAELPEYYADFRDGKK